MSREAKEGVDVDTKLDELRQAQEPVHHVHHVHGDIGGQYADQPGEGGPHPEAYRAGELLKEKAKEEEKEEIEITERETRLRNERVISPGERRPVLIIVMGVSACGKSTVGAALAHGLSIPFIDGDDLHPKSNVEKMSRGFPLTDEDRAPWLARIRSEALRICAEQKKNKSQEKGHAVYGVNGHATTATASATNDVATEVNGNGVENGQSISDGDESDHEGNSSSPLHRPLRGVVVGCSALKRKYRDTLRGRNTKSSETDQSNGSEPSSNADSLSNPDPNPYSNSNLDQELPTYFIFISGSRDELLKRISQRQGHFMKSSMLDSQLATLEPPDKTGEDGVVTIPLEAPLEEQIKIAREGLKSLGVDV